MVWQVNIPYHTIPFRSVLFIIEFINNNIILIIINILSFLINKRFYSRINFSSNIIDYEIIYKYLNIN